MKIVAGIVLYNPNIDRLKLSIEELNKVVDMICLVDNGSSNINEINSIINNKVYIIKNHNNLGIAKALNQLIDYALDNKTTYLLTLDQDSIFLEESLRELLKYTYLENTALLCPIINDLNRNKMVSFSGQYREIDRCITSGTVMNLELCQKVGYFDEKMFIDYVDFDYCKRVINIGMKIVQVKDSIINHEIGKRSKKKLLFWIVYPTNHSPKRIYYYSRNILYYCKKFKKSMTLQEKMKEYIYMLWKFVSIVLYEENKTAKIRYFIKGINDNKKL